MTQFVVDGQEKGWPVAHDSTVADLMAYIQKSFNTEKALVSNVRINGLDITTQDEKALMPITASSLETVEVETVHPRELAEETLQTLLPFTQHLARLAALSATGGPDAEASFRRLIDGLGTFSEAIDSAKAVLKIGDGYPDVPLVAELETGMIATLRQIMAAKEARQTDLMRGLLSADLVDNLSRWCAAGIPTMIRSRDS